jgi:hypothetical protein
MAAPVNTSSPASTRNAARTATASRMILQILLRVGIAALLHYLEKCSKKMLSRKAPLVNEEMGTPNFGIISALTVFPQPQSF